MRPHSGLPGRRGDGTPAFGHAESRAFSDGVIHTEVRADTALGLEAWIRQPAIAPRNSEVASVERAADGLRRRRYHVIASPCEG
jgi:hypothetical protein